MWTDWADILSIFLVGIVNRKVLVLDLDETLIHSHHDGVMRQTVRPGTPPDFVLKVVIDRHPVRFFVHKRPHVDFFLDIVRKIYIWMAWKFEQYFMIYRFHNGMNWLCLQPVWKYMALQLLTNWMQEEVSYRGVFIANTAPQILGLTRKTWVPFATISPVSSYWTIVQELIELIQVSYSAVFLFYYYLCL